MVEGRTSWGMGPSAKVTMKLLKMVKWRRGRNSVSERGRHFWGSGVAPSVRPRRSGELQVTFTEEGVLGASLGFAATQVEHAHVKACGSKSGSDDSDGLKTGAKCLCHQRAPRSRCWWTLPGSHLVDFNKPKLTAVWSENRCKWHTGLAGRRYTCYRHTHHQVTCTETVTSAAVVPRDPRRERRLCVWRGQDGGWPSGGLENALSGC